MSGTIVNNVARASGTIAATPGGLDWSTAVVTGSTVTVEAGRGYFINTTSNACTVTLPASPEVGDQIVLADYARTWATNAVTLDSNGNNFQGEADTYIVDYSTVGQSLNIVYADSTKGWLPVSDDAVAITDDVPTVQRALFAFGSASGGATNVSNLVNSSGVVATDTTGVGTSRYGLGGVGYGGDKAIFVFGYSGSALTNLSNLVSNEGVVASDGTGVGTARTNTNTATYGGDKAITAFSQINSSTGGTSAISNLISSSGVVASDVSAVGTSRDSIMSNGYGADKGFFAFGYVGATNTNLSTKNLVTNVGVVGADVTGVGTARRIGACCGYGTGLAVVAYGYASGSVNTRNLVNFEGVVAADASGAGTARYGLTAVSYGGDKGIFGFGIGLTNVTNLVNTSGVIGSDVTGVGTARTNISAAGYSFSA